MNIQNILEAFDQAYNFRKLDGPNETKHVYTFTTNEGSGLEVMFLLNNKEREEWYVDFTRGVVGRDRSKEKFNVTGEGDAFRIFATILEIFRDFIKQVQPLRIYFSVDNTESSRIKLYDRMITRFANKMGYRLIGKENDNVLSINYTLQKIK